MYMQIIEDNFLVTYKQQDIQAQNWTKIIKEI